MISRRTLFQIGGAAGLGKLPERAVQTASAAAQGSNAEDLRFRRPHSPAADVVWDKAPSFIWHQDEALYWENPRNRFCYFRKTFDLPAAAAETELRIIADTKYILYCNGRLVGRGPSRFDPRWAYYDVHDIRPFLRPGKNVLAVMVLFHGYGTGAQASIMQMLLCHAHLRLNSGKTLTIVTDRSWKALIAAAYDSSAPRVNGRQGPMEVVNLARIPQGWTEPDFDDSQWSGTAVMRPLDNSPWFNLLPRDIPQLAESPVPLRGVAARGISDIAPPPVAGLGAVRKDIRWTAGEPSSDKAPRAGGMGMHKAEVLNLDFGRVEAGLLEMEIDAPAGGAVDVLYAEELWKGIVPRGSNSLIANDRFALKPGKNSAAVQFGWRAFRYAQLWVWSDQPVTVQSASIRKLGLPTPQVPPLKTSDELVNRISGMATHTLRLCMQDGYLDSSSREQQQWIGDGRKQAQTGFYLFGEQKLWRRLLEQVGQSQDWSGETLPRHPGRHENVSPIPGFMFAWVGSMWEYYWFTGKDDLMKEWWPNIVQVLRWFTAFENSAGLLENVPYWAFIDHGEHPTGPGLSTGNAGILPALNLMYLEALTLAARMAEHVGDTSAHARYEASRRRIPAALLAAAWDSKRNAFPDSVIKGKGRGISEPTNVLALLHLPLSDAQARAIIGSVFEGAAGEHVVKGSPNFVLETGRALARHGRADIALRIFRERYGRMLDAGATSIWEMLDLFGKPDGEPPEVVSASHGWGAAVNTFFVESLLGVHLDAPGGRKLLVSPNPKLLASAEGQVMTAQGPVKVGWRTAGSEVLLSVEIPPQVEGTLQLPDGTRRPLRTRFSGNIRV